MIATSLPPLTIRGRSLLPVIQGGMGVGISAHRLAGSVAKEGAIGTIASVDLRRLHPDIMQRLRKCRDPQKHSEANAEALDREVPRGARDRRPRRLHRRERDEGALQLRRHGGQACKSGANAVIVGAGLPFDLPALTEKFKDVALIPILSEERGVRAVLKKWMRHGCLPDAIVIEHPRYAGGHLGATRLEEVNDARFDFKRVLEEIRKVFQELGIALGSIPLIPAGGINSFQKLKALFDLGAAGAQIGTPFAVTEECDAHPNFKQVLAQAKPEDIVTFMSAAGLPARAVLTPWLKRYLAKEEKLRAKARPPSAVSARASSNVWRTAASRTVIRAPASSVSKPNSPPRSAAIPNRGCLSGQRVAALRKPHPSGARAARQPVDRQDASGARIGGLTRYTIQQCRHGREP